MRLAAVAEREHKQTSAAITAGVRIAHHGAGALIYPRFLTWWRQYDGTRFRSLLSAVLAYEALDAGVATDEAMVINQVLINGFGVPALAQL
jgi:hypothetical protein